MYVTGSVSAYFYMWYVLEKIIFSFLGHEDYKRLMFEKDQEIASLRKYVANLQSNSHTSSINRWDRVGFFTQYGRV